MGILPEISEKKAIKYEYFPATWQAVVWRNWGYVSVERLAKALQTGTAEIKEAAELLGLNPEEEVREIWEKRGYLTIIRNNWHLCTYEQLLILLDMTEETLAFTLKEDDFLWIKLGSMKPCVEAPRYKPLTKVQKVQTQRIRKFMEEQFPEKRSDNGFEFMEQFYLPMESGECIQNADSQNQGIRMVYPYFALYGDILLDDTTDHLPERLLAEYAQSGINGIWMQGILYQLVEFPFDPTLSRGWEKRIDSLKKLVQKAKKYGIGIYLYLNEPRSMSEAFFEKYPHLKGAQEGDFHAMCTSDASVKEYLYNSVKRLFELVPELAGFFTITMSENLTNCYSRTGGKETTCPRCQARKPWEVVAEVNNLMAKGAHDAVPEAKAIVWTWGWPIDWASKAVELLSEGQIVQCNSEQGVRYSIGGISGSVSDYSMSVLGPGEYAKQVWDTVRKQNMEISAKVQVNTTWEMATVPYMPVFDLIEQHITDLKKEGVVHLQESWTLGGYPGPNLKFASWLMEEKGTCEAFFLDWLGEENGRKVYLAQKQLSKAFKEFPFHIHVLYYGPHNFGPMAPFFMERTGYEASMIGYPYDDLEKWSAIYPVDIYEKQYQRLCEQWQEGVNLLDESRNDSVETEELYLIAQAMSCHFKSALNHIRFVKNRASNDQAVLLGIVEAEKQNVHTLIELREKDSRLGYESSTHYFYTLQDLKEKLLNLQFCEDIIKR